MEFNLFLPQMRMSFDKLIASARAAEAAGFTGMTGMDHLVAPGVDAQPTFEAMITNTWLAAHTEKLKVGSLVLCDAFRNPAVLARQAVTLDHASGGRFELGIGWGSWEPDFETFGVKPATPRERVRRLRETLEILKALWSGETFDYEGEFNRFANASQLPVPLTKIPVVIGGSGPKTMELVREFADWWNLDVRHLDKYEGDAFEELKARAGSARVSVQEMVSYVPEGGDRDAITEITMKRFWHSKPIIGTGPELLEHFGRRAEQGVERTYAWFCDFGNPDTLAAFGEQVIDQLRVAA